MVRDGSDTGDGQTDGVVARGSVTRDGVARGAIAADTLVAMLDTATLDTDTLHAAVASMGTPFTVVADSMAAVGSTAAADSTVVGVANS